MNGSDQDLSPGEPLIFLDFRQFLFDAQRARLGVGLVVLAWVHLAIFAICEFLFLRGDRAAAHFLPLWAIDVAFAVFYLRQRVAAMIQLKSARSTRVTLRIGLTFAVLCLTAASLNSITGFGVDWFKISWCLLGTFGFATLAWIFHLAFLIPAVQMSLTGLLIAAHPDHAYAIFGGSWFLVLNGFGLLLERRRLFERLGLEPHQRTRVVLRRRSPQV